MPTNSFIWKLVLQLFLITSNAVFACAEIAVISMNDNKLSKLAEKGDKRAVRLLKLTGQPARFLATIQVGITLAGFLGSAFAADNFSDGLVSLLLHWGITIPSQTLNTISVIFITIVLSYFTLILGELVPKRIAMRKAEPLGLAMSGFIYLMSRIFAPLVSLLTASTNGLLRLLGFDPNADDDEVTEEEIRLLVDEGSEKGAIQYAEKEMIENVFEFNDKTAEDVMTHRTEISLLWMDENDEQWEKTIIGSRHTMYPVCDETTDNIQGVLNAKDYFRLKNKNRDNVLKNAVKPPYFVPETVKTNILFLNMKQSRNHFAVVLDDKGGMSGIITMNDLLEQIVGDLDDNLRSEEPKMLIERVDSCTWKIPGSASLKMVTQHLGVNLPEKDYDTFGGFVFGILGFIPDDGKKPELEAYGLTIKVVEIKNHQLEKAVVSIGKAPSEK